MQPIINNRTFYIERFEKGWSWVSPAQSGYMDEGEFDRAEQYQALQDAMDWMRGKRQEELSHLGEWQDEDSFKEGL